MSDDRDRINALGLDFGDVNMRAEAIREDGTFVWSNLSEFGQSLADKSARNPRRWKHDGQFNPFDVPRKREARQFSELDEVMERMLAPILLDFRD